MSNCFYCKQKIGFNADYYLIKTRDTKFSGRKRYQHVADCCSDCEGSGNRCLFSVEEWRELRRTSP